MENQKLDITNEVHRYEGLFNHASMGIIVLDSKSIIQSVNPFGLNLFGYKINEVIGNPIELLIPQRFQHKHIGHRDGYIKKPKSRPMGVGLDLFAVKKDGNEFPVEVSLGKYDNNGEKNVIAFISDITVRKLAEAEVIKLNNELEEKIERRTTQLTIAMEQLENSKMELESAIFFQKAILDNAGAMIIGTDEKGIIKTFNPEAERELGFNAFDLIGKLSPLVFHDMEEVTSRSKELSQELKQPVSADMDVFFAKAQLALPNEYEWSYIRKDGSRFPVLLRVTAMRDDEFGIFGFLGIALNISESKKVEKELQVALNKEKELSELKSRFVSMASHEFRTPLSTILSSASLVAKYTETSQQENRDKHIDRIKSSVNSLVDLLNEFLSIGKIEDGKINANLVSFNIKELLEIACKEMQALAKINQRIKYVHEGEEMVILDPSLLKNVILNLLSNAIKFSSEQAVVLVKSEVTKDSIIITVEDNGIGISAEDQQHLFERFFRAKNAVNIPGTGLGLHIVNKYIEMMQGQIAYKSELEKGTKFIIQFGNF